MKLAAESRLALKLSEVVIAYDAVRILRSAWTMVPKRVMLKA